VAQTGAVQRRLEGSDERVLQIAATRWLSRRPGFRRCWRSELFAAVSIGGLPLVSCGLQQMTTGGVDWFVWVTAAVYGALIALMLGSAIYSWKRVIVLGAAVDAMVGGHDGTKVSASLDRALGWAPQFFVFAFGVVASTAVGALLSEPLGPHAGTVGLAYTFTIGWTGGIGGLTVYWLWGAPVLLYPLAGTEDPTLDWLAPLQTPAVQVASRLMIDGSRLATVGLLLFTIPIALTVALAERTWSVWVLSASSLVFSIITVLGCSILPQMALENLVRRSKSQNLDRIRKALPDLATALASPTSQLELVELYERLAKAEVSIIDWKRLLEYGLLLLSSVVPIAIALLSSK
jgi:hypothetical protein